MIEWHVACPFQKIYIWEEFDETGHNIRVKLSHMHILDILEDLELEGHVAILCVKCSWTVKMLFDKCRIENGFNSWASNRWNSCHKWIFCVMTIYSSQCSWKSMYSSPPDCMSLARDHVITIKCHVILSHDREDEQMDIWRKRSEVFVLCKCPR